MKNILSFDSFLNESHFGDVNESGIPLYRDAVFTPEKVLKRNKLLKELQDLLNQVAKGYIDELSVLAEIPSQGKNAPQYLKDIYSEMGVSKEEDEDSMYDPETDVYTGARDKHPDDTDNSVFVDSEFIVKDIDMVKGVILATPHSLKNKDIIVEIHPDLVDEVFIN
jgi:hypothetical protein